MKALDIAWKDLWHSFRSAFALVFMFVIPLLTVGLFYLAFGGVASDGGLDISTVEVQLVNLDEPASQAAGFSAGELLADFLTSEELEDLLRVTGAKDAASARAAVDERRAAVAVIIPPEFSTVMLGSQGQAAVELYRDPTLTIGPDIVKSVLSQFIDGFAGSRIATDVIEAQMSQQGIPMDVQLQQEIMMEYAGWSAQLGQRQGEGESALIAPRAPSDVEGEAENPILEQILKPIMTGMMIFYTFFTGANSAQSILAEEEAGTLPRLFTTPTALSTILGGKLLAVFATLVVQVVVLTVIGSLAFGLNWGPPLPVILVGFGLVVVASSFGIFLTSLLKSTEQAGMVFGGVMTVTGMLGINAMFTGSLSGTSGTTNLIALLTPQGWAMRGWGIVLRGGGVADLAPTLGVTLMLGVVFFFVGVRQFRKRFA